MVTYANAAVSDLFGYAPDDLIGGSFEVLVPPEILGAHREARQQFIEGPPDQRISATWSARHFLHKDGRRVSVGGSVSAAMTSRGRQVVVVLRPAGEVERDALIATRLQHDLMPVVPPRVGAARIATRYLTAETGRQVGGDWSDVFELPDGRIALVIGDVAGHGAEAAVTMVRLQTSIRMLATSGARPASVLSRVNQAMHDIEPGDHARTATVVHAQLDPASGILAYSSAGHLPLIVLPARRTEALPVPSLGGPPLGVVPSCKYTEHVLTLEPGARLVGFTDGLIERRSKSLDETLLDLVQGISRLPRQRADEVELLADAVLELAPQSASERNRDDVAVMVFGFDPEERAATHIDTEQFLTLRSGDRLWSDAERATSQTL